jgi:HD-GYP domain-containing protein (c-di-GMP phosphodiesterase class II)
MTSDRNYRKALSPERASKIIEINAGSQFDPSLAQAFLVALRDEGKPLVD